MFNLESFIYQIGVLTFSVAIPVAAFALVNFIERGPRK